MKHKLKEKHLPDSSIAS